MDLGGVISTLLFVALALALIVGMARYNSSYSNYYSPLPLQFWFFVSLLFLFLAFSWYISAESIWEDLMDKAKLVLMVSPVVLLFAVHWLSSGERQRVPFIPLPEKDSLHRAGGSPWGVGALLVFLLFMISYQSYFKERWFPMLSRS